VLLTTFVMALGIALGGGADPDRADAANLYDVTCSSVTDSIYFTLPGNPYHQWFRYRLWRHDPVAGWYPYFDAPEWYVQPSWNSYGFVGGGPGVGAASDRNGALTWVTVRDTGWYAVTSFVVYTTDTAAVSFSHEWVTDYSNTGVGLVDPRACWIG
jgi:hypothetical protein